jgi:hypothetical protein
MKACTIQAETSPDVWADYSTLSNTQFKGASLRTDMTKIYISPNGYKPATKSHKLRMTCPKQDGTTSISPEINLRVGTQCTSMSAAPYPV